MGRPVRSAACWARRSGSTPVPLVVLHSGGRFGGTLTTLFVTLFAIVIISGIWGLALQNLLPRLLLETAPSETVYSQIDRVGRQYAAEARRLVLLACGGDDDQSLSEPVLESAATVAGEGHIHGAPRQVGAQIKRVEGLLGAITGTPAAPQGYGPRRASAYGRGTGQVLSAEA